MYRFIAPIVSIALYEYSHRYTLIELLNDLLLLSISVNRYLPNCISIGLIPLIIGIAIVVGICVLILIGVTILIIVIVIYVSKNKGKGYSISSKYNCYLLEYIINIFHTSRL